MMRRILVDAARARAARKPGGQNVRANLEDILDLPSMRDPEIVAIDDALKTLAEMDERKARVVDLRFFGGLSGEEKAEVLISRHKA
jgi:hypothetical protein